ncbi:MAG: pre-peptidase C-terminal domain-containing protein, partial [Phycisphaerae bacterium]|nr:pre-peptidase C-terminal domain-containing protein [Phycisphaerae bacterium]
MPSSHASPFAPMPRTAHTPTCTPPANIPCRRGGLEVLEQRWLLSAFNGTNLVCGCGACLGAAGMLPPERPPTEMPLREDADLGDDASGDGPSGPQAASQSLNVPVLNSLPGAADKLYLDFDGDAGGPWGQYNVPPTPAFNFEGDANSFTAAELAQIEYIWARAAEKFAPFNINVTTVDPGNLNNAETLRAVIGGNGSWYGSGVGGVAFLDSYTNGQPNTVWVFSQNYGFNFGAVAETIAHEAGHGYGLQHQSVWSGGVKTQEYNPGTSQKAPIMGSSGNSVRGLWWLGPSSSNSSPTAQDDLALLSRPVNTFGYRADDHGNTIGTATAMSGTSTNRTASGLIHITSDVDMFSFTLTGGGPINVRTQIASTSFGLVGMLDSTVELLNSAGQVVASAATSALGETLNFNATPGTYYVAVKSAGAYGDIGKYTVTMTANPDTTPPTVINSGLFVQTQLAVQFQFSED